jgi:hypothetical protein
LLSNKKMTEDHAKIVREKLVALERRIEYVFPFFAGNAVHWHAARFRDYMVNKKIENAKHFTIHTVRAIALT